jgi:single-strand DNA-binding protein
MGNAIVTITGNLTADPQVHEFDSGTRKAKFSVACTPSVRDRNSGEYRDGTTTFYDVECWNRLGEHAAESLHKGDPVVVTGRIGVETWQGQDGGRRQSVVVTASAVGHDLARGVSRFVRPVSVEQQAHRPEVSRSCDEQSPFGAAGGPLVDSGSAGSVG